MDYQLARLIVSGVTIVVLVVSIIIAYKNFKGMQRKNEKDDEYRRDKEIVDQCVVSLERAYSVLSRNGESEVAAQNRMSWLTCARMIMRYQKLKDSISSDLYKIICEEQEEYWRHRFYLLVHGAQLSDRYFSPDLDPSDENNIDGRSALVIIKFCEWKKGAKDPLEDFDYEKAISGGHMMHVYRGLREYLRIYGQYREIIDRDRVID